MVQGATPNGSATLAFDGSSGVQFPASLFAGPNGSETIFAVLKPSADDSQPQTILAGGAGALQYRIDDTGPNAGEQGVLNRDEFQFGNSSTVVDPTTFSVIDLTLSDLNTPTALFTDNGTVVGDNGATYDPSGLYAASRFGEAQASGDGSVNNEYFRGDIAEIVVYNTALDTADRQAVEAQLTAQYITPVPEPATAGLLVTRAIALLSRRLRRTV